MRRFMAFLITIATIVTVFVINIVGYAGKTGSWELQTDFTLGMDYKGGYEVLYTVSPVEGVNSKSVRDDAIDTLKDQAKAAGLMDFNIYKEGNNQVRVSYPASSKVAAEAVLSVLESDCQLSFRTTDDESLLADGLTAYDVLLTEAGAKAEVAEDSNGNIAIQLNLSADGLKEFNSWITDGKLDIIEDENNANNGGTEDIVIWFGYSEYDEENGEEKIDSYQEYKSIVDNGTTFLTGEQRIIFNKYTNKILSVASISADVVSNEGLTSREFLLTGNFTRAKANSIIKIINNGGLDYTLERETFARVPASQGTKTITNTAIALAIGLVAVFAFLIISYRLPGVASAFTILAQVGLSLLVYRSFSGLFGPEVIAALLISVVVGLDTTICLFERVKDEMYKGKPLARSFDEASKKANSALVDASVLSLIIALIMFAVGSATIRSIATMLSVSMALCLVLTILLSKLLGNLIFKSSKFEGKYKYFVKAKDIPDVKKGERQTFFGYFSKVNFFKNSKKVLQASLAFLLVGVCCAAGWLIFTGSPLNTNGQLDTYTKITIQSNITASDLEGTNITIDFGTTEEEVTKFIEDRLGETPKEVLIIKDKLTENTKVEFYSYVINFDKVISQDKLEDLEDYFVSIKDEATKLNEGTTSYLDVDEHIFTFSCNTTKNVTASSTILNGLLALGIAIVVIFLYATFRFKLSYSLAMCAGLLLDMVIMFAFLAIFHIQFSVVITTCLLAISIFSINDKAIYFDRVRENLRGSRKKVFSHEEHVEYANKSLQQSSFRSLLVGSVAVGMLVVVIVGSLFSATLVSLVLILGIITSVFTTMFVCPLLWIKLEDKWTLLVANKSTKRKKPKFEEIEEQVFIGIND